MNEKIETHLKKYPKEIADMFTALRQLIYDSTSALLNETMWAKLPSYYLNDKFVRLIPFKDHINIEAQSIIQHKDELSDYKITPKGMLQIYVNQTIPGDILLKIFAEALE